MSGLFVERGNFDIPSALLTEHEWLADSLIDSIGTNCKLVYPPIDSQCPNCVWSVEDNRSANIYKIGGPISFQDFTICPYCGGEGRLTKSDTETVKLRVYFNPKDWQNIGMSIVSPQGHAQIIGYLTDLPKLEKAKEVILNSDIDQVKDLRCIVVGEPQPWGFKRNRYFIAFVKRVGGG